MNELYLLRHGETEWSKSGQHTGISDIPLTPHGEEEARTSGRRLKDVSFQHVLTSPRLRARKTCELAGLDALARVHEDLHEWNYGDYEGLLLEEIRRRQAGWVIYRDGCPGGETPAQVSDRADRVLTLARSLDGRVAFVSHGHFTRVLAARWVGLDIRQAGIFDSATASISILGFGKDGKPVLRLWNRA